MKMCDRCPGAANCLLDYNGKACDNWRKKNAPGVVYSNADRIRAMSDNELADMFAQFAEENPSDDAGAWLDWLIKPTEEG